MKYTKIAVTDSVCVEMLYVHVDNELTQSIDFSVKYRG